MLGGRSFAMLWLYHFIDRLNEKSLDDYRHLFVGISDFFWCILVFTSLICICLRRYRWSPIRTQGGPLCLVKFN